LLPETHLRDYLYLWNDPATQCVVASGLEFKRLFSHFDQSRAILLIDHQAANGRHDSHSGFDFLDHKDVCDLAAEDIYSWGSFSWADYRTSELPPFSFPELQPEEVAELLYFAHAGRPLRKVLLPSLGNQFLAYAHDDGWLLKLYYTEWLHIEVLLRSVFAEKLDFLNLSEIKSGNRAFWIQGGSISREEITFDIDSIINRRTQTSEATAE